MLPTRIRPALLLCLVVLIFSVVAAPAAHAVPPALNGPSFLPGDMVLSPSGENEQNAIIVAGDNGYLAVWEDDRQGSVDIYAVRMDAQGNVLDPVPIVVNEDLGDQRYPKAAWNGSSWLVTWENQEATEFYYGSAIRATRIAADGTVLDPNTLLVLDMTGSSSAMYDLTSNGSDWMVVGQGTSAGEPGILGVRVSAAGIILDPTPTVLVPPTHYLYFNLLINSAGGEYLLTYGASGVPKAARFAADLTPIGTTIDIPGIFVRSNGAEYFVVWSGSGGWVGSPLSTAGVLEFPAGKFISEVIGTTESDLDWGGGVWWWTQRVVNQGATVKRFTDNVDVLDPAGIPVGTAAANNMRWPVVAGGAAGAMTAWVDFRTGTTTAYDIFGAFVSSAGVPGADVAISVSAPSQRGPDMAEGGNGFLLVMKSDTSAFARILAVRLDGAGNPLDSEPIELWTGSNISTPAVSWNGSVFLVVWADNGVTYGVRMLPDGSLMDTPPLVLAAGFAPDVAALGSNFLLVYTQISGSIHFIVPYAKRIDGATGAVLDATPIFLGPYYARSPRVIEAGGRWFAVWQRNFSHDDPIAQLSSAFISPDGTLSPGISEYLIGYQPDAAFSGSTILVTYRTGSDASANADIAAVRLSPSGQTLGGGPFTLSAATGKQLEPVVTWDGEQFLSVWSDRRDQQTFYDDRTHFYGARITEDGVILDPDAFPVTTSTAREKNPAVASAGGTTLIAGAHFVSGAPYGGYRIGLTQTGGTVTTPPSAAFAASPTLGCPGLSVNFTDQSTGNINTWLWDFGDGTSSGATNPTHVYASPGTYAVSLTVSGSTGSDTEVKSGLISVTQPLTANFSAATRTGCFDLVVDFNDLTTGTPVSWLWDFGDGTTSTEAEPSHTYTATGSFTVSLTVTNECGPSTLTRADYIVVDGPCPITTVASGESYVSGDVFYDYTRTQTPGDFAQSITEVTSGGKPANRHSLLEHRWHFDVPAGTAQTMILDCFRTPSTDGDDFVFEMAEGNGAYTPVLTVTLSGGYRYTAALPADLSGPVSFRVRDTDRTAGNLAFDTIYVDYLAVETQVGAPPQPAEPMFVSAVTVSRESLKGNRAQATAMVTIRDGNGDPVVGATVGGSFSGPSSESASAVTDSQGRATLTSRRVKSATGVWCFTVSNVSRAGFAYDPGLNVVDSGCETGGNGLAENLICYSLNVRYGFGGEGAPTVAFALSRDAAVTLEVFDVRGRRVSTLVNEVLGVGEHAVTWHGDSASAGMYFYRIRTGDEVRSGKVVLRR